MELIGGEIVRSELTRNARGGTEMMALRLAEVGKEILEPYQIIFGRVNDLMEDKLRILYLHDLPGDPAVDWALKEGGWRNFHKLVFVSHWQMQGFIDRYHIPYSKCLVMLNAIEPIEVHEKPTDVIRLGYWSTPHRGLNILLPVFDALSKKHENIELEVYSSFAIYGWEVRDEDFTELFKFAEDHPKINYHKSVTNAEIRERLKDMHILAYPSIWPETSCLVLMEAMSAGMTAVHSNLAALPETAANWTCMYQYNEDHNEHAAQLFHNLEWAIHNHDTQASKSRLLVQKSYADAFYNWEIRSNQWKSFLTSDILLENREIPEDETEFFEVSTNS